MIKATDKAVDETNCFVRFLKTGTFHTMTTLHDLPPEILSTFLGPGPLLPKGVSRAKRTSTLSAYAQCQLGTYHPQTLNRRSCEICLQAPDTPHCLQVDWSATAEIHYEMILLVILGLPIVIALAVVSHIAIHVLGLMLPKFEFRDTVKFRTSHVLCAACAAGVARRLSYVTILWVGNVIILIGLFLGALISGLYTAFAVCDGLKIRDAGLLIPLVGLITAILSAPAIFFVTRALIRRFSAPPEIRKLIKLPFIPGNAQLLSLRHSPRSINPSPEGPIHAP